MLRFELTITGQDTVTHALREAAAVLPRQVVLTTYDWAELHVMRYLSVRPYPPERPGQRYKRTGRLGRSWKVSTRGQSVIIENTAPYSGYVVGDGKGQGQAWMHKDRWYRARAVVDEEAKVLPAALKAALVRAAPK